MIYGDFESIAKAEANQGVPNARVETLKSELNKDIWQISRAFLATTFFVYTDEQVEKYKDSVEHKRWTDRYFELLSTYDEFGYFKREPFTVGLDSKENFDQNYKGNWYYYYK